jgi:uncharacterized protein YmfQ (DUF2313 family)
MGLTGRAFKSLLPPGHPWNLPPVFRAVLTAIALSFERLKTAIDGVASESLPSTAVDTLPEWFAALGLTYDATQSLAVRQAIAKQAYTAVGGQTLESLQVALQTAHPDITISTVTPDGHKYYQLDGYTDPETMARALGLVDRIGPAEMEPINNMVTFQRSTPEGDIRVTTDGSIRGGR